jgi:hypothetical protein
MNERLPLIFFRASRENMEKTSEEILGTGIVPPCERVEVCIHLKTRFASPRDEIRTIVFKQRGELGASLSCKDCKPHIPKGELECYQCNAPIPDGGAAFMKISIRRHSWETMCCSPACEVALRKVFWRKTGYPRVCGSCSKGSERMKKCSGCRTVWYCSSECQNADWKRHKADCKRVRSAKDRVES